MTKALVFVVVAACATVLVRASADAQTTPATAPTLIRVDNSNPALATDRHVAAQAAGYRALHYCSGTFSAGLPHAATSTSRSFPWTC